MGIGYKPEVTASSPVGHFMSVSSSFLTIHQFQSFKILTESEQKLTGKIYCKHYNRVTHMTVEQVTS